MPLRRYIQMRLMHLVSGTKCVILYMAICLVLMAVFYHVPYSTIIKDTNKNKTSDSSTYNKAPSTFLFSSQSSADQTHHKKTILSDRHKSSKKALNGKTEFMDFLHTTVSHISEDKEEIPVFSSNIKQQNFKTELKDNIKENTGNLSSFPMVLTEQINEMLTNVQTEYIKTTDASTDRFIKSNINKPLSFKTQQENHTVQPVVHTLNRNKTAYLMPDNNNNNTRATNPSPVQKYPTKPGAKLKDSSKQGTISNNTICAVEILLSPCNCSRFLHPILKPCPTDGMTQKEIISKINVTYGESTCNDWATLRGNNQKVVSFSLFGAFPNAYYASVSAVIEQFSTMYPGWLIRFYHDINLNLDPQKKWLCSLACKHQNVDFCSVSNLPGGMKDTTKTIGTIWRISVMGDPLVSRYVVRDLDSPVLRREIDAVNEWIMSDKCFHIMRDNPNHNTPMMGGMWGGCNSFHPEAMTRLRDTVFRWSLKATTPLWKDQLNINLILWPTLKKSHIAHDSYSCQQYAGSQPFPSKRENFTFVGMRAYREGYKDDQIHGTCPKQCRPIKHQDWEYC